MFILDIILLIFIEEKLEVLIFILEKSEGMFEQLE